MPALAPNKPAALTSGPWRGVRTTNDVRDDAPDLLNDATNVYFPDAGGRAGAYQRPGAQLLNSGSPITTSASRFQGQGVFGHIALDGTTTRFVVFNGELWRIDATFGAFEDVTPAGITIDPTFSSRVYGTSFIDQLIVTDGVNRPWLATNLTSSPITGTYIDYDSLGTTWSAYGPFVVYGGSAFCILNQVNGISRRTDLSWSEIADASTGWQQTDFDNNWTLLQTSTEPLFALAATNVALYYFRQSSIGTIAGPVGPDLATTATHDAISVNVGCQSPAAIVQYGLTIFFPDALGRPYRMVVGQNPEPIWLQMRAIVEASSVGFPGATALTACAGFEPNLNLYIPAIWSPLPAQVCPADEGYFFDIRTGTYWGRFVLGVGVQIESMGTVLDSSGRPTLIILGSVTAPTTGVQTSGYVWAIQSVLGTPDFLTTEGGDFLTTEDGDLLTTEGSEETWMDNGLVPTVEVTTGRLGYSDSFVWLYDRLTALTGSQAPVSITVTTPNAAAVAEGTPTPNASADGIYRTWCGLDLQGRGAEVTLSPTTAASQWSVQSVTVQAIPNPASSDDA